MCYTDVEPCEVWCEKQRVARKEHRCDECRETIQKGEPYLFVSGIFGGPFTHKECQYCQKDRQRIIEHELSEGCDRKESDPGMVQLREARHWLEWTPTRNTLVPALVEAT